MSTNNDNRNRTTRVTDGNKSTYMALIIKKHLQLKKSEYAKTNIVQRKF